MDTKMEKRRRRLPNSGTEAQILRTIMDGLAAMRIFHLRMNSGAMFAEHCGKKRMLRFGRKGMADILAIPCIRWRDDGGKLYEYRMYPDNPIWIECKMATGKQSPEQIEFQAEVEAEGHKYIVATSWESVLEVLNAR